MLIKSNSVPNFLFENPELKTSVKKRNTFTFTKPKLLSYGEFLRTNKNSTKIERQSAIKKFYSNLFNLY